MPTLFLLSNLCIGGSERKTVRVVNALHGRGQNIHLAWLNGPEALRQELAPAQLGKALREDTRRRFAARDPVHGKSGVGSEFWD